MAIIINVQGIKRTKARGYKSFSTVNITTQAGDWADEEVCLFLEGPGHEDAAARIAALINEQVVRRDTPQIDTAKMSMRLIEEIHGPVVAERYNGPDENEALQMAAEEAQSIIDAQAALAEEKAYTAEDEAATERHLEEYNKGFGVRTRDQHHDDNEYSNIVED